MYAMKIQLVHLRWIEFENYCVNCSCTSQKISLMKKISVNFVVVYLLVTIIAVISGSVMFHHDGSKIAEVVLAVCGLTFLLEAISCHFVLQEKMNMSENMAGLFMQVLIIFDVVLVLCMMLANSFTGFLFATSTLAVLVVMFYGRWRCYYRHL